MITLKLASYSKTEKINLYRLLSACHRTLKTKQLCEGNPHKITCDNCVNKFLCKDLQKTTEFLKREISVN